MVVTEALSRGVPALTTRRAGAADLVQDGETGFVVPPADADALAAGLDRVITGRAKLAAMRPAAVEAAARWQWSDYRRELARLVAERYRAWRTSA
jgi:glycosyltransferase involved in cell wall biosynthesis